jgi:precorrin-2 dehydrogenase/sirohydrochlorin ferrochelatase
VAARKARGLLACGADVTVVAPELSAAMQELTSVRHERRRYAAGEAAAFRLVITATGVPHVDAAVHADAEAAGVWVNSADDHEHCTFILPSVHRDGPVTVAVSTGGRSPALASWLRRRLAGLSGAGMGDLAELFGEVRQRLRDSGRSTETVDWAALLDGPLPSLLAEGHLDEARALIDRAVGEQR